MEIYRQKETYRRELLKHIFYTDIEGVQAVLQLQNPYGNFDFTFGINQVREMFDKDMAWKDVHSGKLTIEDAIHCAYVYSVKWFLEEAVREALGEIVIALWNAGMNIKSVLSLGFVASTEIPLHNIQRLDELFGSTIHISEYLKHWYPAQDDLDTLLQLDKVTEDLDRFLYAVVKGRFIKSDERTGCLLSWGSVITQIIDAGADPNATFANKTIREWYASSARRFPHIDDDIEAFKGLPRKRPRVA